MCFDLFLPPSSNCRPFHFSPSPIFILSNFSHPIGCISISLSWIVLMFPISLSHFHHMSGRVGFVWFLPTFGSNPAKAPTGWLLVRLGPTVRKWPLLWFKLAMRQHKFFFLFSKKKNNFFLLFKLAACRGKRWKSVERECVAICKPHEGEW